MRKLIATILLLLGYSSVYALPVSNPAEASLLTWGVLFSGSNCKQKDPCCCWFDAWSVRVGYYGDFVFNRNLAIDGKGLNQGDVIQSTQISTNAGYLALNIANKIDIFGTLGASKITIRTNETSWFLAGIAESRLNLDSYFSWSAGARGTLFEWKHFFLGVEGQYFQTSPDLSSYVSFSNGVYNYFNTDNGTRYREWQAGIGIAYALTSLRPNLSLVPYVASKWAWSRFNTDNFQFVKTGTTDTLTIFNLKAHKDWGIAIGLSATFCDMISVTAEGRWADESAFYLNGNFRF